MIAAAVAALHPSATAHARDDTYIALAWDARDASCPDAAYVEAEVARLLAGTPRSAAPIDARADVTRSDRGAFRVRVVTRGKSGETARTIDAESCRAAADAAAFVLALAIDPAAVARAAPVVPAPATGAPPSEPATSATAATPPSTSAPEAGATSEEPLADARERPGGDGPSFADSAARPGDRAAAPAAPLSPFAVGAALAGDVGTLPRAAIGARASFAWRPGIFYPEIAAAYFPDVTGSHGPEKGDFSLFAVDVTGCAAARVRELLMTPCIGPEIGVMRGASSDVRSPSSESVVWGGAVASAALSIPVGAAFAARLDLSMIVPIARPTFQIRPTGAIHEPAAIVGRAAIGAEAHF